jgi:hypothetical protein
MGPFDEDYVFRGHAIKRKASFLASQTFLKMRSYRQLFQVHEFRREAKSPGLATRPL